MACVCACACACACAFCGRWGGVLERVVLGGGLCSLLITVKFSLALSAVICRQHAASNNHAGTESIKSNKVPPFPRAAVWNYFPSEVSL